MQNRTTMKRRDDAVSPVIGVMLMLVVTIIIAAVISGFAGGLVGSQEAAPSASFDVSMTDKSIDLTVRSNSEDIPSKNIMIVLSKGNETKKLIPGYHTVPFGFNVVEQPVKDDDGKTIGGTGFKNQDNVTYALANPDKVSATQAANATNSVQWFGNYTLKTGSRMSASVDAFMDTYSGIKPEGFTKSSFTKSEILGWTAAQWTSVFGGTATTDDLGSDHTVLKLNSGMTIEKADLAAHLYGKGLATSEEAGATLTSSIYVQTTDTNWRMGQPSVYGDGNGGITKLSPGDRVTVTIVHTPSGQTVFTKTVTVKEA